MFGLLLAKFYYIIWIFITPLLPFIYFYRLILKKEELNKIKEKFGFNSNKYKNSNLIWINAASLGEARSAIPLIKELLTYNVKILFTTVTVTSAKHVRSILKDINSDNICHQYAPIDHPIVINIFLNNWKPKSIIFIESEIWPNIIIKSHYRKIPLILIQGRMSLNTYKKWIVLKSFAKYIFQKFNLIIAQDNKNYMRYKNIGAVNIANEINLKNSVNAPKMSYSKKSSLTKNINKKFIIVFASIHDNIEEEAAILSHKKLKKIKHNLLTIIVPRYPQKISNILKLGVKNNLNINLRSSKKPSKTITDIYVADTIGELGTFYEIADICFIGGSLAQKGGHNLIEPAFEKCAIIFGPDVSNHISTAEILLNNQAAIQIKNTNELIAELTSLCKNNNEVNKLKNKAFKLVKDMPSPVKEILDIIKPILKL